MSVEVDYFHAPQDLWQDAGEEWEWYWPLGQKVGGSFWGATVIPAYANVDKLEIKAFWWSTDNDMQLTANFIISVTSSSGAQLSFRAIRAPSA